MARKELPRRVRGRALADVETRWPGQTPDAARDRRTRQEAAELMRRPWGNRAARSRAR